MKLTAFTISIILILIISTETPGLVPANCSANCLTGSCSAYNFTGGTTSCSYVLGIFPRCKSDNLSQNISTFNEEASTIINRLIINFQQSENPNSDSAITLLTNIGSYASLGTISGEKYTGYYNKLQEFENLILNNFTEDEIATICQIN
jgi:hypothetical protein